MRKKCHITTAVHPSRIEMSEIQDGGQDSVPFLPCVVASEARMLRMRVKIGPSIRERGR